ncbi:MAG: hypothetical protein K9M13_00665 [Simkaniaceae bacterium]|nr:hypothetical protein [Simkaniaceae bacterium]
MGLGNVHHQGHWVIPPAWTALFVFEILRLNSRAREWSIEPGERVVEIDPPSAIERNFRIVYSIIYSTIIYSSTASQSIIFSLQPIISKFDRLIVEKAMLILKMKTPPDLDRNVQKIASEIFRLDKKITSLENSRKIYDSVIMFSCSVGMVTHLIDGIVIQRKRVIEVIKNPRIWFLAVTLFFIYCNQGPQNPTHFSSV